jgi:hypothetical protein
VLERLLGRKRLTLLLAAGLAFGTLLAAGEADAATATQKVHYRGYAIEVPASWPVYDLAADPARCVRFDRHAVYLGHPSTEQRCPAKALGRTEAILLQPLVRRRAVPRRLPAPTPRELRIALPSAGVSVTATWRTDRATVERAVGGAWRTARAAAPAAPTIPRPAARRTAKGATASASYFTGLGFDACSAPSPTTMSAWLSSPYRAIGVYIGGINRGCSQPNLTSTWVAGEIGAGWALIPNYVGRQAPSNSCGCVGINATTAAAQGVAAADDAVTQAAALGIGGGNPIYFDMEGYAVGGTNSSSVLAFLQAWTAELHTRGYVSGVYGSADSTITDLASQYGNGYAEPDDIWIARWNGVQNTSDPAVPSTAWANHQRLHQYRGGHNESYGGISINIDNDYLDGAVVGNASAPVVRRLGRCRKVVFRHRPVSGAFQIRTVNVLHCGKARRVAAASEPMRFTPRGHSRFYSKRSFVCRGHRVGPVKVIYGCAYRSSRIKFVRMDFGARP